MYGFVRKERTCQIVWSLGGILGTGWSMCDI
jgi:hypothetical protein